MTTIETYRLTFPSGGQQMFEAESHAYRNGDDGPEHSFYGAPPINARQRVARVEVWRGDQWVQLWPENGS